MDDRGLGQFLLGSVVAPLTIDQAEAPAVVVDGDIDVVGIVEGLSATLKGGVVESPLR